ncbi:hypothetical protein ACQP1W_23145 [Spirillospora sp. CA-255316]
MDGHEENENAGGGPAAPHREGAGRRRGPSRRAMLTGVRRRAPWDWPGPPPPPPLPPPRRRPAASRGRPC